MKCLVAFACLLSLPAFATQPLEPGVWNGRGASLAVTATGTWLEFDCAHVVFPEPLQVLPAHGLFIGRGKYVPEQGGPIDPGELPAYDALVTGERKDGRMHLDVVAFGLPNHAGPLNLNHDLIRDAEPNLTKCL
jgi:hypothetical protein